MVWNIIFLISTIGETILGSSWKTPNPNNLGGVSDLEMLINYTVQQTLAGKKAIGKDLRVLLGFRRTTNACSIELYRVRLASEGKIMRSELRSNDSGVDRYNEYREMISGTVLSLSPPKTKLELHEYDVVHGSQKGDPRNTTNNPGSEDKVGGQRFRLDRCKVSEMLLKRGENYLEKNPERIKPGDFMYEMVERLRNNPPLTDKQQSKFIEALEERGC